MSEYDISKMDVNQLRNEVQLLRDELAVFKRKFQDILYNLDDENFSSTVIKEKDGMKAEIKVNANEIQTKVSNEEFQSERMQTAYKISSEVVARKEGDSELSSSITQTANSISAIIKGEFTDDILNNYLTGIEITPNQIKMIATAVAYSIFSGEGLRFYDKDDQIEGWSIEPDKDYGGVFNYYINDGKCYTLGTGLSKSGTSDENKYYYTDMVLKALNGQRGSFVVDVTESSNKQIKFFCADWSDNDDTPRILANGHLLATQKWVKENGGSGTAKFA